MGNQPTTGWGECLGRMAGFLILLTLSAVLRAGAVPVASFSASQTTGCPPLNVQFNNTSTGAVSYYWDLGNGNTSTLANPSNTYTVPGTYTIRLVAIDGAGNRDTLTRVNYITVVGQPSADFSSSVRSSCLDNNSYSFSNLSTGAVSYLWDFGDGTTSTQSNPTHSYAMSGVFTVTLIATNSFGCQDVEIKNTYITIFPKPDATVQATFTSSCDPATAFQFSNNAQATSWLWNFGDGTTANQQNPSHVFSTPGTYNVSLMATNAFGCSDTSDVPAEINVGVANWANFSVAYDTGCAPFTANFSNPNTNLLSCHWDFGDGTTSTDVTPSHIYVNPGTYTVTLIVTTNSGCVDTVRKVNYILVGAKPNVNFSYNITNGCAPLSVQFTNLSSGYDSCQWIFGDGTRSNDISPLHTYTASGVFSVTLKCWSPSGCSKSVQLDSIISVTSTRALLNASPRVGCPPLSVNFNALSPGSGLSYFWSFGDGTTSTQQNPTHNYTTSGSFDVMLVVADSLGCSDTLRRPAYIQTTNPAANYVPPPTTVGCAPLTTQFTDGTVGANGWAWDFGDGSTSTQQNPVHTYSTPGFYTVSLTTTTANGGCEQTISNFSTFDVRGGYAGFTHSVTTCPPYEAQFTDTSSNAVSWLWDFGDGTTSTDQHPNHTFASPGYHSVSLTITTADGCTYTTMQSNGVYFTPFGANFYGIPQDTVFPMPVQFYANSVGATQWLWDFGDGSTSTLENPFHTYQSNGNYNVTLWISNGVCTLFYDPPPFNFGEPDTTPVDVGNPGEPVVQQGCAPLTVTFTKDLPSAASWNWDFGDGQTSTEEFPVHTYLNAGIYTVVLTVVDTLGLTSVIQMDSIVRVSGPRAGFIIQQAGSCTNTTITLIDTSANATSWLWNLGDGTTSTQQNPAHVYNTTSPNFIITQTVSDTMGCSSSISTSIYSNFIAPALVSESEVCGLDTLQFYTSMQNYASYLWDFGDNTTSTAVNPSHSFTQEGTFQVSLTVTDNNGCAQTFQVNPPITVSMPVADFSTSTSRQACNKLNVVFTNLSQNADMYLWSFGDGNSSSIETPTYRYLEAGVFDVSLTVFRGNCVSRMDKPQYIKIDTAHAEFNLAVDQPCLPSTATFTDLSANPVSWTWYFGNGDSATVQNPSYYYSEVPARYPMLVMTDINGCVDSVMHDMNYLLFADFDVSVDTGCIPMQVDFQNHSSAMATSYQWDFGDGISSTDANPTHTYIQPGNYDVTLVVSSMWLNCTDTLHIPTRILVKEPLANFVTDDRSACAPSVVNFQDLSVDAESYLWDFGDSTSSTNAVTSHIYNTPGVYTVSLIVSAQGCSDTLVRPQYIEVLGPRTDFTASAFEGCVPFTVDFTDQSQNAIDWNWNFGDGYAGIPQHPTHTYQDTGTYIVSLVTRDTSGCSSFYEMPQRIIVHPVPQANLTAANISGCQPITATFQNLSQGATSAVWNFGDGGTSTDFSASHEYTEAGNYLVDLIAMNQYGCADTMQSQQPINVLAAPQPFFSANNTTGCAPLNITFYNGSLNVEGPSYLWDFGNGQTSTAANPQVVFDAPGFYTVSLTVTNANGCTDFLSFPAMIHVMDTLPPPESKIYSVSVLSNTSVEITWENNPAIDLGGYILYRLNHHNGYYEVIHTETNIQNTGFSLNPTYTDTGLNCLTTTYTYKLQAYDICGNVIPLDQLTAHTTINVSSQRQGNNIYVSWTPYGGCPVSSYEIYRCEPGETPTYLTTVAASQLDYLDTTFTCPNPYSYKIMATDLCGNPFTSFSDTSVTIPLNYLANQVVDVIRSTVVDNQYVLTEWRQPSVRPEMVAQFDVYRSTDNVNFNYLRTVPAQQTDLSDYAVDVQNNRYFYKILVVNTCDITQDLSPSTNTILLRGEMDEARQVHLQWTPYSAWENGVEYYILEKLDEQGHWQVLRQVDGQTLRYDYQE